MQHRPERVFGRYALFDEIASGGMATVHLGRLLGPVGFSKTVAVKRLHAHLAHDPEFVSMFLDEARLAGRIHHPNVVSTLDVVAVEGEVFLVLDYVQGESLSHLLKAMRASGSGMSSRVVAAIMVNALHGLHAAHEATDEYGRPLGIVHRDVSPQNIMVGTDGVARVLDFGVAKAAGRLQSTRDGQLKGKLAYMAPEQVRGEAMDARTDIYSASVVLWEGLAGRRLIHGKNEGEVLHAVLTGGFPPPSAVSPHVPAAADAVVMRGLQFDPAARYSSAREMAIALERALGVASPFEVGEWVEAVAPEALALRAARVREMESTSAVHMVPAGGVPGGRPPQDPRDISEISARFVAGPPAPHEASYPSYPSSASAPSYPSGASQPSQPWASQSSVAGAPQTAAPAQPRRSQLRLALSVVGITAGVGLVGIIALAAWRIHGRTAAAAPPAASAAPTSPAAPKAAAAEPAQEPAEPAQEPAEPAQEPVVASAPDEPPASAAPAEPAEPPATSHVTSAGAAHTSKKAPAVASPKRTAPASSPKSAKPKKGNCDSPFYVDKDGIKHIRPECI